jgi:hypothetical protein
LSEREIEKSYQSQYNIQWAWADSLATNASQVYEQLKTAQSNQINQLEIDLIILRCGLGFFGIFLKN